MFAALLVSLGLLHSFGSTTIQSYICQPPDPPAILEPADGSVVTAGEVSISGTATASSQVILSVDGQRAVQLTADDYNTFSGQVPLSFGTHTLGVTSESPCGNSTGPTVTLRVTPPLVPPSAAGSTTPPPTLIAIGGSSLSDLSGSGTASLPASGGLQLYITAPQQNSRVTRSSVLVTGTTSQLSLIRIFSGDKELARTYLPATAFGLSIPLQLGLNELTVQATSGSDQVSSQLAITRISPAHSVTIEHGKPWIQTVPGIITISALSVVVLALILWIVVVA